MPIHGVPLFDAIALVEVGAINVVDLHPIAHAAFVNTRTGATYGRTTCTNWSPDTKQKLQDFLHAVERDVADMVFGSLPGPADRPFGAEQEEGIGEHAGTAEVASI